MSTDERLATARTAAQAAVRRALRAFADLSDPSPLRSHTPRAVSDVLRFKAAAGRADRVWAADPTALSQTDFQTLFN